MKFLALALVISRVTALGVDWPARVFAPYMEIGADDHFQITQFDDACGQKYYTIAFIIAGRDGKPAWDGRFPVDQGLYADQIHTIRARGGDVIVSFGGEAGREIALAERDGTKLEAEYQSIIDRYQLTWLDFDIEGAALSSTAANRRRNAVLARLQAKNPGLTISYTLPVEPEGISNESQALLADAKARGLHVHSVNVMTMDLGGEESKGRKTIDLAIACALNAHQQCQAIDPAIRIGITPMIGLNDDPGEIFTLADATALERWAAAQPWICSLSFWSSNRDNSGEARGKLSDTSSGIPQKPWAFTLIFRAFTGGR